MQVRDILEVLKKDGWVLARTVVSHRQFTHPTRGGTVTFPGRPSDEEKRGENAGPGERRRLRPGRIQRNSQQGWNAVRRHVVEEQAVEYVESPAQPCGEEHHPLVSIHVQQQSLLWDDIETCHGLRL